MRPYRICSYCVMDTSDPEIQFDSDGRCNHCREFVALWETRLPDEEGKRQLLAKVSQIQREGRGREYDCVIGLSGGVDSSYLAVKAVEWGLRPLVVHVDAGWNSELAVSNIETVVNHCGYELYTHVVDWQDMRELQLSYLRSGVANQDVPQDHAFFAGLYHFARKEKIKYVLSGGNIATEGIFPKAWLGPSMDAKNLLDIHRKFGNGKLYSYRTVSFAQAYFWYPLVLGIAPFSPLNYMDYVKDEAVKELECIGWRRYPRKHGESAFTKFFQNYYLPTRFGYDKRRPHLSSLVAAGQMTREEALVHLAEPLYLADELKQDTEYFCRKLRISDAEFNNLLSAPCRDFRDFKTWDNEYAFVKGTQRLAGRLSGRKLKVYS